MTADELLRESRLSEALEALQQDVRGQPADAEKRIFLFQLLCVLGQWERALTQLNVVGELDAGALPMVQTYREAIQCEALRAEIFAGRKSPLVFGDPEPWIAMVVEALRLSAEGKHGQAIELRERAYEEAPATAGRINENEFQWISDADSRLGPLLEAIVNGKYYLIPFSRIAKMEIEQPSDLRDLVWTAAIFTWANGGQAVGLIPTRYAGSYDIDDDLIKLAKKTDWIERGSDSYEGIGQRMFLTDTDDYALMDVRTVQLDTSTDDETNAEDGHATTKSEG